MLGLKACALVYNLPLRRENKLRKSGRRLLLYFAERANDKRAEEPGGVYACWPSEETITKDLDIHRSTFYRGLRDLTVECGLYLVTLEPRKKGGGNLYVLHIRPEDLTPQAILLRKQSHDARVSSGRRKQANTSQIATFPAFDNVANCEISTSQNATYSAENTSQIATQNRKREIEQEGEQKRERAHAPAPGPHPVPSVENLLTPEIVELGRACGLDEKQTKHSIEKFVDRCRSSGASSQDWNASLRLWLRKEPGFLKQDAWRANERHHNFSTARGKSGRQTEEMHRYLASAVGGDEDPTSG
jgi:hypothetical protein